MSFGPLDYEAWGSRAGQGWINGTKQGQTVWDQIDFHVDLGCGIVPKGRIGIDRFAHPNVSIVADLDSPMGPITYASPRHANGEASSNGAACGESGLPFADDSVESIISHHALEHVANLIPLMDECWRILKRGGIFYAITPLFPSTSAVQDPDHKRYFMAGTGDDGRAHTTWDAFCSDDEGNMSAESFSVPYTQARFKRVALDWTPPAGETWSQEDNRELRCALEAIK